MNISFHPMGHPGAGADDELVVLDASRRVYAGLNRARDGWHLIQPARLDDPRVGDGLRQAGQLVCTCAAGTFRGRCYRVDQAEALEGLAAATETTPDPGYTDEDIAWLRQAAPGEVVEMMGS